MMPILMLRYETNRTHATNYPAGFGDSLQAWICHATRALEMKLEGGERLVLKTLLELQGDSTDYIQDSQLANATKMLDQDVRDWLETLEGKGFVERTRLTDGFSVYVTAMGKQALRLTEPISSPKPAGEGAPVTSEPPGGTGAPFLSQIERTEVPNRRRLIEYAQVEQSSGFTFGSSSEEFVKLLEHRFQSALRRMNEGREELERKAQTGRSLLQPLFRGKRKDLVRRRDHLCKLIIEFERLHKQNVAHIKNNEQIASHEITQSIHTLLYQSCLLIDDSDNANCYISMDYEDLY